MMINKKTFKHFLFPYYPKKFFKCTNLMVLLSFMLALRIVLNYTAINIPNFAVTISFSWLPVYVVGWIYGPIVGLFFGMTTDTIIYFLNPSIWFWMYAIQEPIVGLVAGFFGGIYSFRKQINIYWLMILQKIIIISFILVVLLVSSINFSYLTDKTFSTANSKFNDMHLYLILMGCSLIAFYIGIECVNFYNIHLYKKTKKIDKYALFTYSSILIIIIIVLFSFILGPISALEYYKFTHNGNMNPKVAEYGLLWYLIPRIIKESIKTPLYIMLFYLILNAIEYDYKKMINLIRNKY